MESVIIKSKMYRAEHFCFVVMDGTEDDQAYVTDDLDIAIDILKRRGCGLICVIDDGEDPVVFAELTYDDLFGEGV